MQFLTLTNTLSLQILLNKSNNQILNEIIDQDYYLFELFQTTPKNINYILSNAFCIADCNRMTKTLNKLTGLLQTKLDNPFFIDEQTSYKGSNNTDDASEISDYYRSLETILKNLKDL